MRETFFITKILQMECNQTLYYKESDALFVNHEVIKKGSNRSTALLS